MTFVKSVEINVNWLLNQVLGGGKTNYQITKIDNDTVTQFLNFLKDNPFEMPDGQNALKWVRNRIGVRYEQCQNMMSKQWEQTRQRYRFIMNQADLLLISMDPKDLKEPESEGGLSVSFGEPAN